MLNKQITLTAAQAVARARSVIGHGKYQLGGGGRDPKAPHPFSVYNGCDCSGFVAWSLGIDRFQPGAISGSWIETSMVYGDAASRHSLFESVPVVTARPGDVIVWPDRGGSQGHIGLVATVTADGRPATVVHCSKGNERRTGTAVQETTAAMFISAGAIVARVKFLVDPPAKCAGVK